MLREIVVLPNRMVPTFAVENPFAAVTFVGTHRGKRTPPKIAPNGQRIVIRADDCYPDSTQSVAFTADQARRIVRFVSKAALKAETLMTSCRHGHGRSASLALVTAAAYGLAWERFTEGPFAPNGWMVDLLTSAFASMGVTVPRDLAACDVHYDAEQWRREICP